MFCEKCGTKIIDERESYCRVCGNKLRSVGTSYAPAYTSVPSSAPMNSGFNTSVPSSAPMNPGLNNNVRFMPSFVLGLIAAIFGMAGGLCVTMCTSLYSTGAAPFIFIFGGSIVGLVGACKCLKDAKKGSILQLVAAAMIIICAYGISGADFASMIALILFLVSGVIGLLNSNKKY